MNNDSSNAIPQFMIASFAKIHFKFATADESTQPLSEIEILTRPSWFVYANVVMSVATVRPESVSCGETH